VGSGPAAEDNWDNIYDAHLWLRTLFDVNKSPGNFEAGDWPIIKRHSEQQGYELRSLDQEVYQVIEQGFKTRKLKKSKRYKLPKKPNIIWDERQKLYEKVAKADKRKEPLLSWQRFLCSLGVDFSDLEEGPVWTRDTGLSTGVKNCGEFRKKTKLKENIRNLKKNILILKENLDSKRSVKVVLYRNGVVLLLKNKYGWDLPGGHVMQGETPISALEREVYEETGLTLLDQPLFLRDANHNNKEFYVSTFPRDDINLSDEHSEYGFFSVEDCMAKEDLAPFYKEAIKLAVDPEAGKNPPSRSEDDGPAYDSPRGAPGVGGPATQGGRGVGGLFAPGSGPGGSIR